MTYSLGLDLGTTNSAAAIADAQGVRMLSLGHDGPIVASVIHVAVDGSTTIGRPAVRRAEGDPAGVAREFKRRFGDTTPFLLHGAPVAANDLTLQLASYLVTAATELQGDAPGELAICHPANWGAFKTSLLSDTFDNSPLPPHRLITEPEAAAIHYASQERVADGSTIAVYDLGGGTFDVAILRKTDTGWERIGRPGGIERLGGIDFDTAIFQHVLGAVDLDLSSYDDTDAAAQAGVARLRADCTEAKHSLSADTSATVSILLPGHSEQVRITRHEFETLIGPAISRSLETFDNTLSAAGLGYEQLDRILMVGGSSRIPLVSERVSSHTGRPLATDAHPKHACALGAAIFARSAVTPAPATTPPEPQAAPAPTPAPAAPPASTPPAPTPPAPTPPNQTTPPPTPSTPAPAKPASSPRAPAASPPSPPAQAQPPTPPAERASTPEEEAQIRQPLGGMFQELPHISEGRPDFLDRGRPTSAATPPPLDVPKSAAPDNPPTPAAAAAIAAAAQPTNWLPAASGATQANPVLVPTDIHMPGAGRPAPQVHKKQKSRSGVMFLVGLLLVLGIGGAAAYAGGLFDTDTRFADGDTSSTTIDTSSTSGDPGTTIAGTVVNDTGCPDDRIPDPALSYQIKEIAADDKDGGANARTGPGLGEDTPPVTVLPSFTPLELAPSSCEVDEDGRVWWGVVVDETVLWVSSSLIVPAG